MSDTPTNIYADGSTNNHYRYGTKHIFLGLTPENANEIRSMDPRIHKSITIALTDASMSVNTILDVVYAVAKLRSDYNQTMQLTIVAPKRYKCISALVYGAFDKWVKILIRNELRQHCTGLHLPGCDMIIQYKVKHLRPRYVTLSEVDDDAIREVASVEIKK